MINGYSFSSIQYTSQIKCIILMYWWLSAVATSISIHTKAGSEVRQQQIRRCFASHHDRLTQGQARPYFFTWIFKGLFLLSLQQELPELWRIIAAIVEIDGDVLQRIWAEMVYRLDICPDTKGGHIQHLCVIQKKKPLDSFSVHLKVLYYKHFRHLSVQIFWIMNNPVSPPYVFCLVKYCIDRIL